MITFQSMTFGYGKKPLFEGLDLDLEPGSIYGLLGLNGAGKTSFLKLAAGALRPQRGEISVFGRDPSERSAEGLADIYFVPEDPWLPPIAPSAWIERYASFRPAFDRDRFEKLLDELALERDKVLTKYSYGQKKKFALAAALSSGAHALLLDEPTNGLDIPSKAQLRRILAESADPARVVVVSTHQVRDLENIIDPVIIVHGGKVLFRLSSEELGERLFTRHLSSLEGEAVVYAERDALGWSALLAKPASPGPADGGETGPADLELVFDAAIAAPERLEAALRGAGSALEAYRPEEHEIAKEASK
jgi:ABC-2 type transport system ATP-binding protein